MDESWTLAQQSVLGACLIDERAVGSAVFSLGGDDFQGANKNVFAAIKDLYTGGKPVDVVSVLDALGGGAEYRTYLAQLMEITPTAANVQSYIGICRERSRVAKYREIGLQLMEVDSSSAGAELVRSSNGITVWRGMQSSTMREALHDFFGRYNKKAVYIPWFIGQLNGQVDMEFGDFCLLGGRPSSGKSAFALECAIYWAAMCGWRVGFYSCETSREKLTNRILAACARVPLYGIKHSCLDDQQMTRLCTVSGRIAEAPIDLISAAGKTVAEIQANALAQKHQIIIVDYLQIVKDSGKDEYAQVSNISKALHTMCASLGVFCLALCQLNRTKGARPTLEDLRSSGQLEQDADSVFFLHRPEGKDRERELIIAKNKEGECRTTRLNFDGPVQHFSYLGRGDTPVQGIDYTNFKPAASGEALEQLPISEPVPFEEGNND